MTWLTWKENEIKSIQILRAIAALSVVYVHCTISKDYYFPATGLFGVDIFFIISGFIIAFVVTRDVNQFMIKRVFRIYPMYLLATLGSAFVLIVAPNIFNTMTITWAGFIKSLFFIPDPEKGSPILGQGWTLRFEMFFYFAMYLSLLFVKNKKYSSYVCIAFIVIFLSGFQIIKPNNYMLNYFNNGLLFEFVYGVLLFKCYEYVKAKKYKVNNVLKISMSMLMAIIGYGSMVFFDITHIHVTGLRHIDYGIPSLLLAAALLTLENNIKDTKVMRGVVKIGEASFVMYLVHYHIVIFFSRCIFNNIISAKNIFIIELVKIAIAFIMTIIISIIIYEGIDKPIQKQLKKFLKGGCFQK